MKYNQALSPPIALFVKQKRKELGYTQAQLALRIGVGLAFLRALEQGKPSLRLDKVNDVLNFFGCEAVPAPKGNTNKTLKSSTS